MCECSESIKSDGMRYAVCEWRKELVGFEWLFAVYFAVITFWFVNVFVGELQIIFFGENLFWNEKAPFKINSHA